MFSEAAPPAYGNLNAATYGKADAEAILSGKVKPANVDEPLSRLVKMLDAMH